MTTSQKNGRQPQKINGRRLNNFFEKQEWRTPKKMEDDLKKMEDDLKKNGRQTNQPKST